MDERTKFTIGCFALLCVILVLLALSYLFIALMSYLICLGFDLNWSWLLALGVWAAMVLIWMLFNIVR